MVSTSKPLVGTKLIINHPQDCPAEDAVSQACRVLHDQQLSIYQVLYVDGLTSPGSQGGQFRLRRSVEYLACVEIIPSGENHRHYGFFARSPEGVKDKVLFIAEAIKLGKMKVHSRACCPLALIRGCVCDISFDCPVHGVQCHGTHD